MFNDMTCNCIVRTGILILFFALIYYMDKCDRQKKQLKTLRMLILIRSKDEKGWPDDEDTKGILEVLENHD